MTFSLSTTTVLKKEGIIALILISCLAVSKRALSVTGSSPEIMFSMCSGIKGVRPVHGLIYLFLKDQRLVNQEALLGLALHVCLLKA